MLTLEEMSKLRTAYEPYDPASEPEVLAEIGNPTREEIIATTLAGMASPDRNVRVLALRVLRGQAGEVAMRGVLAGLNDPKRRVREVAIKSCGPYRAYPEITARLREMVTDEHETRRIRQFALGCLAGQPRGPEDDLAAAAAEALTSLAELPRHRFGILFGLVRLELGERVGELLHEFVRSGTKEEAVMATRALCGYRVVGIGAFERDKAIQDQVKRTCEIAHGRVWYWIRRDEYATLLARMKGAGG